MPEMFSTRPIAARDYWTKSPFKHWLTREVFNAVYVSRTRSDDQDPLEPLVQALAAGDSLVIFPEGTRSNLGELLWRIGMPLSALVLALLAVPLSFVNPRAGRSVNLLFALLTYMVSSNLLSVSQARVAQGKMAFATGWWLVHAAMILVLFALFARRLAPYWRFRVR